MKIKKGDTVLIISGKDRGKKGKVTQVLSGENRIIVEGVNIRKKHVRQKRMGEKGQRVEVTTPFSVSNAKLICPKCNKSTRVGYRVFSKGERGKQIKVRMCKKCRQEI